MSESLQMTCARNPTWAAERIEELERQLKAAGSETPPAEADAVVFASELFSLINYRRTHSLSRDVWHEADETDEAGQRCIAFLCSRNLIENDSRNATWWRFVDPAKRAKPPNFHAETPSGGRK